MLAAEIVKNQHVMWRPGFDPWIGKISWRRKRLPTPVFSPGEFHRQRSLAGYSLQGHKGSDMTEFHFTMETQTQRRELWTQWGKKNMGQIERVALKHVHYHM